MNLNLTRQRRAATPAALSAVRQAPAVMPFSGGELLNSELESSESRGSLKLALLYDYFFAGKITQSLSLYRFVVSRIQGRLIFFPFSRTARLTEAGPGQAMTSQRPISKSWWGQGKQQEPRSELRAQPRPRGRRRGCSTRLTAIPQSRPGWSQRVEPGHIGRHSGEQGGQLSVRGRDETVESWNCCWSGEQELRRERIFWRA